MQFFMIVPLFVVYVAFSLPCLCIEILKICLTAHLLYNNVVSSAACNKNDLSICMVVIVHYTDTKSV